MFFACGILQPTALAFAKLSVVILLHQIFIPRAFRLTCWGLGSIVLAWWIAVIFAQSFICLPVSSIWDPSTPGHCGNQKILQVVDPLPWVVTDFAILIAPLPVLRKLQTSRRQKAGLMALFLIGGITCVCTCVRYSTIWYSVEDITWDIVPATIWNVIEAYTTIICACLIATRPLFMKLIPDRLIARVHRSWSQYWQSRSGRSRSRLMTSFGRSGHVAQTQPTEEKTPVTKPRADSESSTVFGGHDSDVQDLPKAHLAPFSFENLGTHNTARERYEARSSLV